MKKWPYLGPWAKNQNDKETLFSLTFRVERTLANNPNVNVLFWSYSSEIIWLKGVAQWLLVLISPNQCAEWCPQLFYWLEIIWSPIMSTYFISYALWVTVSYQYMANELVNKIIRSHEDTLVQTLYKLSKGFNKKQTLNVIELSIWIFIFIAVTWRNSLKYCLLVTLSSGRQASMKCWTNQNLL